MSLPILLQSPNIAPAPGLGAGAEGSCSVNVSEAKPEKLPESLNIAQQDALDAAKARLKAALKGLTGLKSLYLNNTDVTYTGVKNLQAALPKCQITQR